MARGLFQAHATINSATDTAVIAAPGKDQRINVLWLTMDCPTAEASSAAIVEDGVNGNELATLDCTATGRLERVYHEHWPLRLTENTALNVATPTGFTGTAVLHVNVGYEVT